MLSDNNRVTGKWRLCGKGATSFGREIKRLKSVIHQTRTSLPTYLHLKGRFAPIDWKADCENSRSRHDSIPSATSPRSAWGPISPSIFFGSLELIAFAVGCPLSTTQRRGCGPSLKSGAARSARVVKETEPMPIDSESLSV